MSTCPFIQNSRLSSFAINIPCRALFSSAMNSWPWTDNGRVCEVIQSAALKQALEYHTCTAISDRRHQSPIISMMDPASLYRLLLTVLCVEWSWSECFSWKETVSSPNSRAVLTQYGKNDLVQRSSLKKGLKWFVFLSRTIPRFKQCVVERGFGSLQRGVLQGPWSARAYQQRYL